MATQTLTRLMKESYNAYKLRKPFSINDKDRTAVDEEVPLLFEAIDNLKLPTEPDNPSTVYIYLLDVRNRKVTSDGVLLNLAFKADAVLTALRYDAYNVGSVWNA